MMKINKVNKFFFLKCFSYFLKLYSSQMVLQPLTLRELVMCEF